MSGITEEVLAQWEEWANGPDERGDEADQISALITEVRRLRGVLVQAEGLAAVWERTDPQGEISQVRAHAALSSILEGGLR